MKQYPDCDSCRTKMTRLGFDSQTAYSSTIPLISHLCQLQPAKTSNNCIVSLNFARAVLSKFTNQMFLQATPKTEMFACGHILRVCPDTSINGTQLEENEWSCSMCSNLLELSHDIFEKFVGTINEQLVNVFCKPGHVECKETFQETITISGAIAQILSNQIFSKLSSKSHVAKCIASGKKERYSYMVMTLLGESLESLLSKHGPFFNVSTQVRVGICLLFGIKQIHDFENEVNVTADGDCYATVLPGCQNYLMRKDRIIKLLTDEGEIDLIKKGGWMLQKPPKLPPLVADKACFAFYIDGSQIATTRELQTDALRPWSASRDHFRDASVKPNVRRHAVGRVDGQLQVLRVSSTPELFLTEFTAFLPRFLRLRKKIFYLTMNGNIYGNVLILYEYTSPGEVPTVLPRGGAQDSLVIAEDKEEEIAVNPFESDIVEGPSGGIFLRVKPEHTGWSRSLPDVLRYLINEQNLLAESDYLNREPPFMPPLIETTGVFVFFAASNFIANPLSCEEDGLAPWSQKKSPGQSSTPRVRTIRRGLIKEENGAFKLAKNASSWATSQFSLVESVTVLARCQRLRKRLFYIQRANTTVVGNVCFIYEYLQDGPIPQPFSPSDTANFVEEFEEVEPLEHVVEMEEVVEGDGLHDGYDLEVFDEDPLEVMENQMMPFYEQPRQLEGGHFYLTVRDKRISGGLTTVLEWIINSTIVEDRGILNASKPPHPPIVRNERAYAFFVASNAIIPHDVNRDDFSPWSHNGDTVNPTCYRSKVKKVAMVYDEITSKFFIDSGGEADFRTSAYHLVSLYSVHPRENRLRKKIYYVMETASRTVVSHALIIYDYKKCGELPVLTRGANYAPRQCVSRNKAPMEIHDVENDYSDMSESEKTCPFMTPPCVEQDGSIYLQLDDVDFWNNRNRHLHYLINKPQLVQSLQCLNSQVPAHPPLTTERGIFVYFVNRNEVPDRQLTMDQMMPWSDNSGQAGRIHRRPKCTKWPLAMNCHRQLRVWKSVPRGETAEYQLHIYLATLPRAPRLRKKVMYVLKNGEPIGHAMIIYNFTEAGPIVQPLGMECSASSEIVNVGGATEKEIGKDQELQGERAEEAIVEVEGAELLERAPVDLSHVTKNQMSAIWRMVRNTLGASSEEETFDLLFRLLFERNEPRLLQNVSSMFGVEIMPENEQEEQEEQEEMLDEELGVEIDEVIVELEGDDEGELGEEDDIFFEHHY